MPDWDFDLWNDLVGAPDSYGTSIGCKKKKKSDCKKLDSKPTSTKKGDATTSTAKEEPTTTRTDKEDSTTTDTKTEEPSTTSTTKIEPTSTSTEKDDPTSISTNQGDSSTSSTSTSTSASDSCTPTAQGQSAATCEKTTPCEIQKPDNGDEDALSRRDVHRSPRRDMLSKRYDKKRGNPCSESLDYASSFSLESDSFPQKGDLDVRIPMCSNSIEQQRWLMTDLGQYTRLWLEQAERPL